MTESATRRCIRLGLLSALALALNLAESALLPSPLPGVKPGIANVVSLAALVLWGWRDALAITLLRITLGGLLSGSAVAFTCSLSGGIASLTVVQWFYSLTHRRCSALTLSLLSALTHNAAQLTAMIVMLRTPSLIAYAPLLTLAAAASGLLTGTLCALLLPRLRHSFLLDRDS